MGDQAVQLSKKVNYSSAGTVEFIVDKDKNFYFLEMNTRLQVEHPVTELITGIDLVEQMINIAYGKKLEITQNDVRLNGSAIETRIYAENPYKNFLPSIGRLTKYNPPKETQHSDGTITRNDTGVREGDEVSMFYDPMIAKLCSWGKTRDLSINRMETALDNFLLEGIDNNISFLSAILANKRFKSGVINTAFIDEEFREGFQGIIPNKKLEWTLGSLVLAYHICEISKNFEIFENDQISDEWEVYLHYKQSSQNPSKLKYMINKDNLNLPFVCIKPTYNQITKGLNDDFFTIEVHQDFIKKLVTFKINSQDPSNDPQNIQCRLNSKNTNIEFQYRGITLSANVFPKHVADYHKYMKPIKNLDKSNLLICPMPGKLIKILVKENQIIEEGQSLCVVEAMKMENTLVAPKQCTIKKINYKEGDTLSVDQVIMEFSFK